MRPSSATWPKVTSGCVGTPDLVDPHPTSSRFWLVPERSAWACNPRVVSEREAHAYLRHLVALHLPWILFPLGVVLAGVGFGPGALLIPLAPLVWVVAILSGAVRAVVRHRHKPLFGADSIVAETNWWNGWAPIPDAAAALGRDARQMKKVAWGSTILAVALFALLPVVALVR